MLSLISTSVIIIIIIIRHQSGLDRPVSTFSLCRGLLSRLRPFGLQFGARMISKHIIHQYTPHLKWHDFRSRKWRGRKPLLIPLSP